MGNKLRDLIADLNHHVTTEYPSPEKITALCVEIQHTCDELKHSFNSWSHFDDGVKKKLKMIRSNAESLGHYVQRALDRVHAHKETKGNWTGHVSRDKMISYAEKIIYREQEIKRLAEKENERIAHIQEAL